MKFLVDAQLPIRLAHLLKTLGYDAIHTRDLPKQNRTTDRDINIISMQEERVVITKDSDFLDSFLVRQEPHKLLLITTGNISNSELEALFLEKLPQLIELPQENALVEMSRDAIIVH